jgi:DNA-binding Lrp family transcriptional regulator
MSAAVSLYDAPLNAADVDRRVLSLLRFGAPNAQTCKNIGHVLGVSERAVRSACDRLIKQRGVLVGSSTEAPAGVFLIATEAERLRYQRQLISRLREVADRARRVQRLPLYGRSQPADLLSLMSEPPPGFGGA